MPVSPGDRFQPKARDWNKLKENLPSWQAPSGAHLVDRSTSRNCPTCRRLFLVRRTRFPARFALDDVVRALLHGNKNLFDIDTNNCNGKELC